MQDEDRGPTEYQPQEIENIRIGYRVAVQLWTYEGSAAWNRFSVILVANSILVGIAGSALADNAVSGWTLSFPAAGLVLCFLWWTILRRGMGYQFHYTRSARCLEKLLEGPLGTVSEGEKFGDAYPVQYDDRPGRIYQMPFLGQLKMRHSAALVIAVFFVVNVLLLATSYAALQSAPRV